MGKVVEKIYGPKEEKIFGLKAITDKKPPTQTYSLTLGVNKMGFLMKSGAAFAITAMKGNSVVTNKVGTLDIMNPGWYTNHQRSVDLPQLKFDFRLPEFRKKFATNFSSKRSS